MLKYKTLITSWMVARRHIVSVPHSLRFIPGHMDVHAVFLYLASGLRVGKSSGAMVAPEFCEREGDALELDHMQ
jgi:hypothetical protein